MLCEHVCNVGSQRLAFVLIVSCVHQLCSVCHDVPFPFQIENEAGAGIESVTLKPERKLSPSVLDIPEFHACILFASILALQRYVDVFCRPSQADVPLEFLSLADADSPSVEAHVVYSHATFVRQVCQFLCLFSVQHIRVLHDGELWSRLICREATPHAAHFLLPLDDKFSIRFPRFVCDSQITEGYGCFVGPHSHFPCSQRMILVLILADFLAVQVNRHSCAVQIHLQVVPFSSVVGDRKLAQ